MRWASPEVLNEGKFSRASDVWAFGILVYEVMSRGLEPYAESATLLEVTELIKAGKTLKRPEECPKEVYARVMQPCWTSLADRPGFQSLCATLVDLGVVSHKNDAGDWPKDVVPKEELSARLLQGPSVHHLATVVASKVPESATIATTVQIVLKPASANTRCPRDGELGCAYVDTLVSSDDVGQANALLSYTWRYKLSSVVNALQRWAHKERREAQHTYIWICCACINQHRVNAATKILTPEELAAEFGPRVLSIGRILTMLEPWRNPIYLSRAWCLFELCVSSLVIMINEIDCCL